MKRFIAFLLAGLASLTVFGVVLRPAWAATAGCGVTYQVVSQWSGAFMAQTTITNLGDPVNSWALTFDFVDPGQQVTGGWNAIWRQSGVHVTASNQTWNGTLPPNTPLTIGFSAVYSGVNPAPVNFALNGIACTGKPVPVPTTPVASRSVCVAGTPATPVPCTTPPTTKTPPPTTPATTAPNEIVVRGMVRSGVEMGCLILAPDVGGSPYLLIGGDRTIIVPGAHLEVRGILRTGIISYCMQGTPLQVISAQAI